MRVIESDSTGVRVAESSEPSAGDGLEIVEPTLVVLSRLDDRPGARVPGMSCVGVRRSDGARVVVAPDTVCGVCDRCRAGLGAHCAHRRTLGDPGAGGTLSEAIALLARQLTVVPEHVPDEAAAMAHLVAVALGAAGRLHIRESPYATVIGAGALALLTAEALAAQSATVRVLSTNERTLDACAQRGMRARPAGEPGRRRDQDIVVVCPGEPEGLVTALAMAAPRGRVVLTPGAGEGPDGLGAVAAHELDILGSRWAPVSEGLDAIARGRLDPAGLLTRRVRFDRAAEALAAVSTGDELAVGVAIS